MDYRPGGIVVDASLARRLEAERNEARNQLYRIVTEGFDADDTITGETCAEYVLRRLGKIPENAERTRGANNNQS